MKLLEKLTKEYDKRISVILKSIVSFLPDRLKRIVFIGVMISYLTNDDYPDKGLLIKVNNSLNLANSPKAYELPIAVKNVIWSDFNTGGVVLKTYNKNGREFLSPESKVSLCYYIANSIPVWLKYSDKENIYTDALILLDGLEKSNCLAFQKNSFCPIHI